MKHILFFILSFAFISLNAQQTVYVEIDEENIGRGILKQRGNECFVITPEHLLKDKFGEELFDNPMVYGEGSVKSESEKLLTYNNDLAILRFTDQTDLVGTSWKLDRDFDKVIQVTTSCKLELREKTGVITTMVVNLSGLDEQYLYIKPQNFREEISQGMSGASLFTEYNGRKVYLGMLQNISQGDKTGEVLMADEIEKTIEEFFNPRKKINNSVGEQVSMGIYKEVAGLKFEFKDMKRSGSNVNLELSVTSLEADKLININYRNVIFYDENGTQTTPSNILIGNKSGGSVEHNLVHGIEVPLELHFNKISSSAKYISLLKFMFYNDNSYKEFEIRDLELPEGSSIGSQYDGKDIKGTNVVSNVEFKFLQANKTGTEVICNFTVTSLNQDKSLNLHYRSILLYDDKGSEYKPSNIQIANKSGGSVDHLLIHGLEVPVTVKFENVSSSIQRIALLKMGMTVNRIAGEFQIRNIPVAGSLNGGSSDNNSVSGSACSELYVYRMKGFMQCEEQVQLLNHNERVLDLEIGTRYKTIICSERELQLKATIGNDEIGYSGKRLDIKLGERYYLKVGCSLSVSKLTLQNEKDGYEELNKNGKYSRDIKSFELNEW